ncbi:MAG: response regulator [bacterium]|nr:response regulator [bacterium]
MSYQTSAQNYVPEKTIIKKASAEYGFDISFSWTIFQDRKGFLWIGTSGELLRYDGLRFKAYRNEHENVHSLAANAVRVIYEDNSGIIWIGTGGGGLNKYNHDKENFIRYIHNLNDSNSISANYIYSICEDKSGNLWIGTELGLNFFNRRTEKFRSYKNIPEDSTSLSSNLVTAVFEDSKSNLWIGTIDGGLNLFDRNSNKFFRFIHNPEDAKSLNHNKVTGICEDKFGNVWVSTLGGGLNKITYRDDIHSTSFISFKNIPNDPTSLSDNDIASFYIDKNNTMWLATWGGGLNRTISSLNDSQLLFTSFKNDPDDPTSLSSNNVSTIFQDNSGILWIGTWGGSINLINLKQKQFKHYNREKNNPNSLSANGVMSIFEDRAGIIWIGTWDGGLNKWDRSTNKFTHYKHNADDPFSLSDNSVSAIYEDSSGDFWIGTWNGGLNKFDRARGKFYHFNHNSKDPSSISDNRILSITEDESGNLWIGTYYGGLNKFDKNIGKFTHNKNIPDDSNSLSSTDVHELLLDNSGILWIGTKHGGLQSLDLKSEKFSLYKNIPGDINTISNDKISDLYQDKSGTLWIGTQDAGLNKFDRETGIFKSYRMGDGLANNFVMGILEDDSDNLWISTSNGLSKFNIANETFRNYYVEDGLQNNEFEELCACWKIRTGELIFGGVNGFNIFYPDSIKDNMHIPTVYITDFKLFNKSVLIGFDSLSGRTILKRSIIGCEEIELNHSDNVFTLEFAALDFQAPNKNKYEYILEGFDKEWTYTDANNSSATYTNLDPGDYVFRVKGSNNDGLWNEKGALIKIIILPPWYQTTIAYLVYIVLIGSIIYFTWKTQVKRLKSKHEYELSKLEASKMHEVDEIKTRFFTNISHEFRTPLTLILGPAKNVLESTQEPKTKHDVSLIKRNAGRLLGLVNQLLDISKLESGNMKLQTASMNIIPLLKGLVLSFSSFAERKRITLKFSSAENEIMIYLDKDKFEKIITNILSNALKFTPEGGSVEVEARRGKGSNNIEISDTGIGIPADRIDKIFDRFYQVDGSHTREHEGTGIGLSLTKELIELHKGKISVESEPGKESTFTISLPLGKDHLRPEEICEPDEEKEYEKEISETEQEEESKPEGIRAGLIEKDSFPLLLIVEDNSDVRSYIKDSLKTDYRIIEAVDGEDGLNKSIENLPDLIVSDVMMPKMDGFKLCEKIKTDERTSHVPVILLTAKAAKEDKLAGFETGADEYLMKPFDTDELQSRIKNLIEQRKRLQNHFKKQGLIEIDKQKITSVDKMFLRKSFDLINKHISDSSFSVEILAEELAISRSGLQKKIQALIGETPGDLIRRIRLNKAAELIKNNFGNLSEVALEVGYNNPAHFSEAFKKQFGVAPSQYLSAK